MSEYETIVTESADGIGVITLNRPKALNALNTTLMNEVVTAAEQFDADPEIGAIVITGSERAFAAGADIKEMSDKTFSEVVSESFFGAWDNLSRLRTPTIAAVTGYALGGGCELAMLCDILIAGDNAVFGQPEINLGVIPGIGGSQRLTRAIGKAKAMDLILTGRQMKVDEAERAGLVSRAVPAAECLATAKEVAVTIAGKSSIAAGLAKDAVNRAFETTLTEGVRAERGLFYSTFATDDQTEGMAAFVAKREPDFRNR
ncbi:MULTISPECIES: enoyl-CoA hydratase [unclassified Gordonia (in: high G+C Gram-positive bacteria)]|uniref:enoyl-CoA hydratase n=1 Tax=unclassified Gordonia (in: high G+C Gram-positive bacteria) TaxID=2657482 RepID=UPI0007EAC515|nr:MULTISPECIES: enoyl-CoA hydratase [unclassified Gordonia (in: high G+C Gram-positive bacteria)]OBB99812.1 enoyl-CoA hydratase [Gordonia sp. 852002-50395_SCH5434458]OBC09497.1 enoyl-CoA hydratase [Gordonia sp. 852002-50816_SCH5313054-a]OBC13299.1 enoyl-CoA hydratase [Gordonia sp. 852002-50816_SCH5313054-c]